MARIKHTPTKFSSSSLDYKTIIKYARLLQTLIISLEVDTIDDNNNDKKETKPKIINPQITNNSSLNKPSIKRRGRPKKIKDDDKQTEIKKDENTNIIIKKEEPPINPPINNYDDTVKVDYTGITELMNDGDIELK